MSADRSHGRGRHPETGQGDIDALIAALASAATGANEWDVRTKAPVLTASILRELPSAASAGEAAMYRLVLACNAATHEGEMQIAWAPDPQRAAFSATVDGKTPFLYPVETGKGATYHRSVHE